MKSLRHLLVDLSVSESVGNLDTTVARINFDSRNVELLSLFVAVRGLKSDGHDFIEMAVQKGASAVVCEKLPEVLKENVAYVQVTDSAEALGKIASAFYGNPSAKLRLVGITGTNGKTTVASLLWSLVNELGFRAGLLSTVENKIGTKVLKAQLTTPDAVSLNKLLADMVAEGCDYAFMEVSSHAIEQKRIAGLTFTGGVFTNLSHDHLDYHKTFKAYIFAKKKFFDSLSENAFALINIDDKRGEVMVQNTRAKVFRYGLREMADFKAKVIENSLAGLHLKFGNTAFFSRLIGEFNAYNLLATYAVAIILGFDTMEVLTHLSGLKPAEGRFEPVFLKEKQVLGIVDYAHTPDSLEKVLNTIREITRRKSKVITVVGCGGDRDKLKRPVMAKIACLFSDTVILTSDNPRTEKPDLIIDDMEKGIPDDMKHKVLMITDRKQGIRTAYHLAQNGDVILIAGKGHEKYQEIMGVKHPFDDKEILRDAVGVHK